MFNPELDPKKFAEQIANAFLEPIDWEGMTAALKELSDTFLREFPADADLKAIAQGKLAESKQALARKRREQRGNRKRFGRGGV